MSDVACLSLANGRGLALVDADVVSSLPHLNWCLGASGYAQAKVEGRTLALHSLVVSAPEGYEIDHRNRDKLDNRRANLRVCTRAENNANRRPKRGASSAYKGVSWDKRRLRWVAQIMVNRRNRFLGSFFDELDAARRYDEAARELFGYYAYLNFP